MSLIFAGARLLASKARGAYLTFEVLQASGNPDSLKEEKEILRQLTHELSRPIADAIQSLAMPRSADEKLALVTARTLINSIDAYSEELAWQDTFYLNWLKEHPGQDISEIDKIIRIEFGKRFRRVHTDLLTALDCFLLAC